jgi:hypothetical protein
VRWSPEAIQLPTKADISCRLRKQPVVNNAVALAQNTLEAKLADIPSPIIFFMLYQCNYANDMVNIF